MDRNILAIVLTIILVLHFSSSYSQTSSGNTNQISIQEDPQNQIGLAYTAKKLEEVNIYIKDRNFSEAEKLLIPLKDWLTDATEYHYLLYESLSKDPKMTNQSKIEKAHALDFGKLRDESYFLLAKIYIEQNKLKDAVKILVEIIKSQSNTSLGQEAYKTLQEIKFSDRVK